MNKILLTIVSLVLACFVLSGCEIDTTGMAYSTSVSGGGGGGPSVLKPINVTEPKGNGDRILGYIIDDDNIWNPSWIVCSMSYLGATPMTVTYDVSSYNGANAELEFESKRSGSRAFMDIFCGDTQLKADWLPPNGINQIEIPSSCYEGDRANIRWVRKGGNCLRFDYIHLKPIAVREPYQPIAVSEANNNGVRILNYIVEDDNLWNPSWVVCSRSYLGATPMTVTYDVSSYNGANAELEFESKRSGSRAFMDIFCGDTQLKADWLPPNGINQIEIPSSCYEGDRANIRWVRKGGNCLRFDYMNLNKVEDNIEGFQRFDGGSYQPDSIEKVYANISYQSSRDFLSLLWRPSLPDGWVLGDAYGDGDPEVTNGEILFIAQELPNPLNFYYEIIIPYGANGTKEIFGEIEYWLSGMPNENIIDATPNPIVVEQADMGCTNECTVEGEWSCRNCLGGFYVCSMRCGNNDDDPCLEWVFMLMCQEDICESGFCTDCSDSCEPEDSTKCGSSPSTRSDLFICDYHEDGNTCLDWRPIGSCEKGCLNGACIDPDPENCGDGTLEPGEGCDDGNNEDGDGCSSNCTIEDIAAVGIQWFNNTAYGAGSTAKVYVNLTITYYDDLMSLLWRPGLPAGWVLGDTGGDGSPESSDGEIAFVGHLSDQMSFYYEVIIPPGESGTKEIFGEFVYALSGMVDPATKDATPNPIVVSSE